MANIRMAGHSQRLTGWCGIAFAVLLFIALVLTFPPDTESCRQQEQLAGSMESSVFL